MDSAPNRLQPSQLALQASLPYHGLRFRAWVNVFRIEVRSLTAAVLHRFVFAPPYRRFQNQRSQGLALHRFKHKIRFLLQFVRKSPSCLPSCWTESQLELGPSPRLNPLATGQSLNHQTYLSLTFLVNF